MKIELFPKKFNYELVLFVSSFLFFYFYIRSYGLTLDSDEINHIYYFSQMADKGKLVNFPVTVKPLPVLLVSVAYYTSPLMYEFVTAIFSSLLILFLFKLCSVLFERKTALLASILVLINPLTFSLTLGGNSIIVQASLVTISYYFLVSSELNEKKKLLISFFFLLLSCLTRPEPWIFIPLVAYYIIYVKRFPRKEVLVWTILLTLIIPGLWLLGDYLTTGELWWVRVKMTKELTVSYNVVPYKKFPITFLKMIDHLIVSSLFIFLSVVGFLCNIKNVKRTSILPMSFLFLFLFYWALTAKEIVVVERYFFINYLVIAIYSAVGIFYIFDRLPLKANHTKTLLMVLTISLFTYYLEGEKIINSRRIMQFTSDVNTDIIRSSYILKRKADEEKYLNILMSSRRIPLMLLQMRGNSNTRLTSFRQLYYQKSTLKNEKINWVIYNIYDIYPPPVQQYFKRILSSSQTLQKEGITLSKMYKISESTLLLKLNYE